MKYIIKNIKLSIQNEKMGFFLVLLCAVVFSFMIYFSYGIYQHYHVSRVEMSDLTDSIDLTHLANFEFRVSFDKNSEGDYVSKEKIKRFLSDLPDEIQEAVDMFYVMAVFEEWEDNSWFYKIPMRFCISNGTIAPCRLFEKSLKEQGFLYSGRYFSEQEEKDGERVALVRGDEKSGVSPRLAEDLKMNNDTIQFQGKEYKIIGMVDGDVFVYFVIPFESLDDDTVIDYVLFHFEKPVTRAQYNKIKEEIEQNFGALATVPKLNIDEVGDCYYHYDAVFLMVFLVAVLEAVIFALLYRWVLLKRKKMLAVFWACGCTRLRALKMLFFECMLILGPIFVVTTFIYAQLALPELGRHFEHMESAYNLIIYLYIFMIYMVVNFIALLLMINFGVLNKGAFGYDKTYKIEEDI